MAGPPLAVTFDFWNTLVGEDPGVFDERPARLRELLGEQGTGFSDAQVNAAFEGAWQAYVKAWKANQRFGAADAVPVLLTELGLADPVPGLVDAVVHAIEHPAAGRRPPLAPNIAATLATLREAGVRLGIICDVGLTPSRELRRWLAEHGVLDFFDHWSFSDEVGVFKPDPRIFRHALAGLGAVRDGASGGAGRPAGAPGRARPGAAGGRGGPDGADGHGRAEDESGSAGVSIDPARSVHVGDLRRTDIAGALAMGMTAVRYTGIADDPVPTDGSAVVEATHVIADHAELPALLGLT